MIRQLCHIPVGADLAFSGGVDSVAAASFLHRKIGKLLYFHHQTPHSEKALSFCADFAKSYGKPLVVEYLSGEKPANESQEEFWRKQRYAFLRRNSSIVVTAHHLDDAVETWLFSAIHGTPKLIPVSNEGVLRPFLSTPKSVLVDWCQRRGLQWCEDDSNLDVRYMRNLIRARIVPEALRVNPGLRTVIRKKYEHDLTKPLTWLR